MRSPLLLLAAVAASMPGVAAAGPLTDPSPPEVLFSQAIIDKAAELGNDPVRIYEFVRNDLDYEVYWGLMKGAEGALVSGGGNEYDLSALLVSLLRTSGYRARFVRGRVLIPGLDAVGITGAAEAAPPGSEADAGLGARQYWAAVEPDEWHIAELGGDLGRGAAWNATTKRVERWHVWVEAEVPIADYRGTAGGTGGLAWLPLDASMKVMVFQPGIPIVFGSGGDVAFDYLGEEGLYRTVDERDVVEILEDQIQEFLAASHPGKRLADVTVRGPPQRLEAGVLPTALPYPVDGGAVIPGASRRGATLAEVHGPDEAWVYDFGLFLCTPTVLPTDCRNKGWAFVDDGTADPDLHLAWSGVSAELEGRRVSLSFVPVDPDVVPGTSCEDMEPHVKIDAVDVPLGGPPTYDLCQDEVLAMAVARTPKQVSAIRWIDSSHILTPGGVFVPHFDVHGSSPERTRIAADTLLEIEARLPILYDGTSPYVDRNDNQVFDPPTERLLELDFAAQEELIGGLLELASVRWAERLNDSHERLAGYHHRPVFRLPAAGLISSGYEIEFLADAPVAVRPSGLLIDVKGAPIVNLALNGLYVSPPIDHFTRLIGHAGSEAEHRIWEEIAGVEAVSTLRGMNLLAAVGESIETVQTGDVEKAGSLGSCRPDVRAWISSKWRTFLPDPGESLSAFENAFVLDGDCTGIDITTYCELKTRFGTNRAWRAPAWDLVCPNILFGTVTDELRIARNARFSYRGWDGHVYYAKVRKPSINAYGIEYSIQPFGGDVLGGGWAENAPVLGNDPFDLSFLEADLFTFFDSPEQSIFDVINEIDDPDFLSAEDAIGAALLYDADVSLLAFNSPVAFETPALCCDPVSMVNGNFHHEVTDLVIRGRGGFDLRLVRSYNSRLDYAGPLGFGWTHTFDQHLRVEPGDAGDPDDDRVIHVSEAGGETIFFDKPTGFLVEPWVRDRLVRESDGSYKLTSTNGIVRRFLPAPPGGGKARLDRIVDRNGNEIEAVYDDPAFPERLTKVRDSAWDPSAHPERELAFSYDAAGHLTQVSDWTGRTVRYEVDAAGDLVRHWDPVQAALGGAGRPTVYSYYSGQASPKLDHNLRILTRPADRDDPGDDGDWRMEFAYWGNDMVRHHTNALGERTFMDYNFIQKRTRVTHPDGSVEVYVFNRHGRIVRRVSPRGVVRRFEYDPDTHEPTLAIDGLGHATEARYDARGNPTWRRDREGFTETWLHNEFSQPTRNVDGVEPSGAGSTTRRATFSRSGRRSMGRSS